MTYDISLKIHEEADLYSGFDPDQTLLSDEVISYIVRRYQEKDLGDKPRLHIISDLPLDEDRVRKNIRDYMQQELEISVKEQKKITLKQLRLAVIGIAFIAVWLVLSAFTGTVIAEVLSIIGSFAVWEAANIWIIDRPEMRLTRMRLKKLMETEVIFTKSGNSPVKV